MLAFPSAADANNTIRMKKVVLNAGQHTSITARDGSFTFRDVTAGVYLLEVQSTMFHYSAVKIKVDDKTGIIAIEYKASRRFFSLGVYT